MSALPGWDCGLQGAGWDCGLPSAGWDCGSGGQSGQSGGQSGQGGGQSGQGGGQSDQGGQGGGQSGQGGGQSGQGGGNRGDQSGWDANSGGQGWGGANWGGQSWGGQTGVAATSEPGQSATSEPDLGVADPRWASLFPERAIERATRRATPGNLATPLAISYPLEGAWERGFCDAATWRTATPGPDWGRPLDPRRGDQGGAPSHVPHGSLDLAGYVRTFERTL